MNKERSANSHSVYIFSFLYVSFHLQGNVEVWLGDLLKMSKQSVHSVIRMASIAIGDPSFNMIEFENSYPAQVWIFFYHIRRKPVRFLTRSDRICTVQLLAD